MTAAPEVVATANGEMPVLRFSAGESAPSVLLATDVHGVNDFYRYLGSRLAESGFTTYVPDLFFRLGAAEDSSREAALRRRARLDDRQALADLTVVRQAFVAEGQRFGLLGFCLGGSLVLLAAADAPEAVTASYYGFPRGAPGALVAAEEPISAATRTRGPVLGIWGDQDYIDRDDIEELRSALDGSAADYDHRVYPGVGHAFLGGLTEPGPSSAAAHASWQVTTSFLGRHLLGDRARLGSSRSGA
ncbi:dienelactone hydrolase family protein [Umezawaea sp. NPDC059074]|uniref:dienelactone hydrolase family protein n=1 Tax=Umezawaea sp. NPDC059074 TaxID=3346716 RepID=UPI0036A569DC